CRGTRAGDGPRVRGRSASADHRALGGARGGEEQEESAAGRPEGRGAGREARADQLRILPRREGQGRWAGGGGPPPEASRLDLEGGARRDRRRAVLEDHQWPRPDAAVEASVGKRSLGPGALHPLPQVTTPVGVRAMGAPTCGAWII